MTTVRRSGSFVVSTPSDDALELLSDRERVVRCLPDRVESVDPCEECVEAVLKVGTPAVRTRLRLRLRASVDEDAGRVRYAGHGRAARSRVELDGDLTVEPTEEGARIEWDGEARITGLLASLGESPGAYDDIVTDRIDATIENVRGALAE